MKDQIIQTAVSHMEKAMHALQNEISRLRTGRASLAMLDDVRVDYYGQMMPINQVATLGIPEPRLITITPWEQKIIPVISKAIEKANLGLSPVNDGKILRISIPPLTTERRAEIVKMLKKHAEESRIAIRLCRREAMEGFKKLEKDGSLPEDESKKLSHQVQKLTDDTIAKVDEAVHKKEAEIMQV